MTGKKKAKGRTDYNENWGGRRPNQSGRPALPEEEKKHTKCFWVTQAEEEALIKYLDYLRNGKPVEEE